MAILERLLENQRPKEVADFEDEEPQVEEHRQPREARDEKMDSLLEPPERIPPYLPTSSL